MILWITVLYIPNSIKSQVVYNSNQQRLSYTADNDPFFPISQARYNYEQCIRSCHLNATCMKQCKVGPSIPQSPPYYPEFAESVFVQTNSNISYEEAINAVDRYVYNYNSSNLQNIHYLPYYGYEHIANFPNNNSWKVCVSWAITIWYTNSGYVDYNSGIWSCGDRF